VADKGSSGPTQSADPGKPRLILTDTALQFVGDEAESRISCPANQTSSSPRPATTAPRSPLVPEAQGSPHIG